MFLARSTDLTLEQTDKVDLVTEDAQHEEIALILVETRRWEGSPEQLAQLKTKLNNYISFALEGEMLERFPEAKGKSLRIQFDCTSSLPTELVESIRTGLRQLNIGFSVNVIF